MWATHRLNCDVCNNKTQTRITGVKNPPQIQDSKSVLWNYITTLTLAPAERITNGSFCDGITLEYLHSILLYNNNLISIFNSRDSSVILETASYLNIAYYYQGHLAITNFTYISIDTLTSP